MDSGLSSLLLIAAYHGIVADEAKLRHEFGQEPFGTATILLAAKSLGFTAKVVRQDPERLRGAIWMSNFTPSLNEPLAKCSA